jgi:hypothetical protein
VTWRRRASRSRTRHRRPDRTLLRAGHDICSLASAARCVHVLRVRTRFGRQWDAADALACLCVRC